MITCVLSTFSCKKVSFFIFLLESEEAYCMLDIDALDAAGIFKFGCREN